MAEGNHPSEDLSEEFKQKAATIFETAIKAKVKEESQRLQGEYETKLKEDTETQKAELVEKVDSYLNYVVEEWMQENKIAIERGIKGEIAEDFIGGLKKLFEDHYIDVPDEKYDDDTLDLINGQIFITQDYTSITFLSNTFFRIMRPI